MRHLSAASVQEKLVTKRKVKKERRSKKARKVKKMKLPKYDSKTGMFTRQLDYEKIAEMYAAGKSYSEISHVMECSSTAIAYALKSLEVKEKKG